ncbi:hypothetical protein BY996DRAFT_6408818 [Phakopsora pachyrhizi]|nr:hypothetical protein BY996DRAFT_6408818 [Phakopsora pachyrhizi]
MDIAKSVLHNSARFNSNKKGGSVNIAKLKNSAVLRDNLDLVRLEGEVKEIPNQLCTLSHLIEDVRADFVGKQFAIEEQLKYYQDNDQIDLLQNKFNDLKSSVVLKDNPDLVKLEVESIHNLPRQVEEIKADLSKHWTVVNHFLSNCPDLHGMNLKVQDCIKKLKTIEKVNNDVEDLKRFTIPINNPDLAKLKVESLDFSQRLNSISAHIEEITADLAKEWIFLNEYIKNQTDLNSISSEFHSHIKELKFVRN